MITNETGFAEFLTDYPLYRKATLATPPLDPPSMIKCQCRVCRDRQIFDIDNMDTISTAPKSPHWVTSWLLYFCHACKQDRRLYILMRDHTKTVMWKIGQNPAWSIEVPPALEAILGQDSTYYKHALICMSQSYGLGACAYLRRIVEDRMDDILRGLRDHMQSEGVPVEQLTKVDAAIRTSQAVEKATLAANCCPASLRPGGFNPFTVLHHELSTGIHSLDDQQAMEVATNIQACLGFIVQRMADQREDSAAYLDAIKKISDTRSKRPPKDA